MVKLESDSNEFSAKLSTSQRLVKELLQRGYTISIAEGCTGGQLLDSITIPGSTKIFRHGIVAYSNSSKIYLGVSKKTIDEYGEYSPEVALSMVEAIKRKKNESVTISTVGQINSIGNTSSYCHVAYSIPGKLPFVETIILPPNSRRLTKKKFAEIIFSNTLSFFDGYDNTTPANIFSYDAHPNNKLVSLIRMLKHKKLRIATMESCTGGALANAFTDVVGSSKVFDSSFIAYDENIKNMLGVPMNVMIDNNVYSEKVATAMAQTTLNNTNADLAIATTGTMDTIDTRPYHQNHKPGIMYVSLILKGKKVIAEKINLPYSYVASRDQLKAIAVDRILDLILHVFKEDLVVTDQENFTVSSAD